MDSRNSKNTGYGLYHILGFITKRRISERLLSTYNRILLYKKPGPGYKHTIIKRYPQKEENCRMSARVKIKHYSKMLVTCDPGYSCYNACNDNEPKAYQ